MWRKHYERFKKTPFIESLLGSLTTEQLGTLKTCLNKSSIDANLKLCLDGPETLITSSMSGQIKTCFCRLAQGKTISGIFICTNSACVIIGYTNNVYGSDILPVFSLDLINRKYSLIEEFLTADELRRVLDDSLEAEGETALGSLEQLAPYSEELLELGTHGGLQYGYYIYMSEPDRIEYVEEVPEDYSGIAYGFLDDGFYVNHYENGSETASSFIGYDAISVYNQHGNAGIDYSGVDKVQPSALFGGLTHSFDELDPTLKALIESAISAGEEVACSQAQWNSIKQLLDNSLYLNYNDYSLIKSYFDGIGEYHFGAMSANHCEGLYIYFYTDRNMLYVEFSEV